MNDYTKKSVSSEVNPAFESQEEFQYFCDHLSGLLHDGPVGVVVVKRDGAVQFWSNSCKGILGYSSAEVTGKMKLPELSGEAQPFSSFAEAKIHTGEEVYVHKDGSPRILHQIVLPVSIRNADDYGRYTVCLLDVTERREAEEALRREKNMLNLVLDAMGAGLALFDADEKLQWSNKIISDWFGHEDRQLHGMACGEVYRCPEKHCGRCAIGRSRATGNVETSEIVRLDPAGERHCFRQLATPLKLGRHQYIVLSLDITKERRRREHLRRVNELGKALTRSLDPQRVQHLVLTCVTAGHALGFNRAFLFLIDDRTGCLEGSMAVGPMSLQEARRIWTDVSQHAVSLDELLEKSSLAESDEKLTRLIRSYRVSMKNDASLLVRATQSLQTARLNFVENHGADKSGPKDLLDLQECVVSPLVERGRPIGAILADNRFSGEPVSDEQLHLLEEFSSQASLAIGNALAYQQLSDQMEELKKAQNRLVEAERMASVGRMAAHLAHEIRNPLTTVGGFAKSIERNCNKPAIVKRNSTIIYNESMRLEKVLEEALDFTRPVNIEKEQFQLNHLLKEIAGEYENTFNEKSIKFKLELEENLPPLTADRPKIKQVIINLIRNAIDALEDSPKKLLLIDTSHTNTDVRVSVADSGQGMDEETQKNIFAPFFTTHKGGTGLGLSICRKIITEHGGRISVDSTFGKGSSFKILLPKEVQ